MITVASSPPPASGSWRQRVASALRWRPALGTGAPQLRTHVPHDRRRDYAVALACAAAVLVARAALGPYTTLPFVTFFPGVLVSAWYGGIGPGLVTTALCALAAGLFWMDPGASSLSHRTLVALNLGVFVFVSALVTVVTAAFRESSRRLARMLEAVGDGVYALDRGLRLVYANNRFAELVGVTPSDIVGHTLGEFFPGIESRPFGLALREALERQESVRIETWTPVLRRWLESEIYPHRDGATVFVRDVSARREVEQQRATLLATEQAARAESERAGRLKDEFLATLSHELRTPLNAVMGWAQLLAAEPLDSPRAVRAVGAVQRNALLLKQLVDDLLDVSSIVTGKLHVSAAPVDLVRVTRDAIEVVRASAEAKDIAIDVHWPPTPTWVSGDSGRLQQVIWNLLSNAVKFTPTGGRVDLHLVRAGGEVIVTVRDTGIGIAPEFLPRVFERFTQAEPSLARSHGGLGLGLAIVRHLVEAHGGNVSAESDGLGSGAAFTLRLPAARGSGGDIRA